MEKRFYLGLGVLLLLLAVSVAAWLGMQAIHQPEEQFLARASDLALAGDMEQAVPLAEAARSRWERYRCVTASVADHSPMDDTENLFAEMAVYAAAGEDAHFAACCLQLSNMAKAMYDAHSFTLWNLL